MTEVSLTVGIKIAPNGLELCSDEEAMAEMDVNLVLEHQRDQFVITEVQTSTDGRNFKEVTGAYVDDLIHFIYREHWVFVSTKAYENDEDAFVCRSKADRRDTYAPILH